MEFYVKYWKDFNSLCDFPILPTKESFLIHNNILLETIEKYLISNTHDDMDKIHIAFIGESLFHIDNIELYSGFDSTIDTIKKIKELAAKYNKKISIRIFSNLLEENLKLFKYVINEIFINNLEEVQWRAFFNLDTTAKSLDALELYIDNLYEISTYLAEHNQILKIKSCITKNTIKTFDSRGLIFKTYLELIRKFKFITEKYENFDDVFSNNKNMYILTDTEYTEFFNMIKEFFPSNINVKIINNKLGKAQVCLIENNCAYLPNYASRENFIKIVSSPYNE